MKRILIIVLMFFLGPVAFAQHEGHNQSETKQQVYYTCPMHPEIKQAGPGKCPKCGMALVKKSVASKVPARKTPAKKAPVKKQEPSRTAPKTPVKKSEFKKAEMPVINKETKDQNVEKAGHKSESPGVKAKPKTVRYDLYVKDTLVNYGRKRKAIAITQIMRIKEQ